MPERRHLQNVIESAIDFAVVVTDSNGIVTDWNTGAENIFGWRRDEMLGTTADRLFNARDRAVAYPRDEMRVALAEGRAGDERWHLRKDGSEFWASGELMPLRSEDGRHQGYVKILRDRTGQREAGERLRRTEDRFRTLLDTIETAFAIVEVKFDADDQAVDYRFLEANPAFERQAGVNLRGKWVTEFAPDLEQFWFDTYGRVARTGEPANFENYAARFERWFDVRAIRVSDPAERQIAIFFNDVTARKHAEDELRKLADTLERQVRERTEELTNLWATSPDLLLVMDFAGNFWRVNPAWTTMLGYAPEDLVGRHVNEFVIQDDHAQTVAAYRTSAAGGQSRIVNRYRHKDGSARWISWVGAPAGNMTYATGRDITAEKEREALLRDAQDFARLALSAVGGVGVWTYDIASDTFTYDEAIAELYAIDPGRGGAGISREAFLANVHPDDKAALGSTMSGGSARSGDLELEYRLCHPDGSVRWVLSRGHTYRDAEGRALRRTGVGVETTSQRQTEEALRQSQKMEAVGQLTGGLAHDFNNLLAGISGSLELMQARVDQGRFSDLERLMTVAQGAARRAAALTHRLLAFSRRQTLTPKAVDVDQLIAGMEELIRRTIGPAITLEMVGGAGLWPALIDAGQLENALLNLCINARDAMPDGGRITIETANRRLYGPAAVEHDLPEGQYLSLSVTDTGTGMPPEVIARVFEPFFTTKPIGMGTGLGLSMIHGFAQQSGGQVRIISEIGHGTTVCLYLPRHHGAADGDDVAPTRAEAGHAAQGETVLIVDDESSVRMLVTEVLEDLGYTAIEAADSRAGLKVVQSEVHIDLLVTDVGLPGGMNGRQMADAARERRPGLKVLFITGYAEHSVIGHGHLEHGMEVLTKPFTIDALAARIKNLIASR